MSNVCTPQISQPQIYLLTIVFTVAVVVASKFRTGAFVCKASCCDSWGWGKLQQQVNMRKPNTRPD